MNFFELLSWTILACPLAAFLIQIFRGSKLPRRGDWVSVTAIGISLFCSLLIFLRVVVFNYNPHFIYPEAVEQYYHWFSAGSLIFGWGFLIDNLTAVMLMVVSIVSFLVHVYSIGYMHHEPYYHKYFGYLSLFSFSMFLLVLCDNLFLLYISWELVGVSSYLLIGFFFWKDSAADACKKAFLTTRVGDIFMLIGIMIVIWQLHTFNYREIFTAIQQGELNGSLLTVAAICLFGGAIGKSAQFPLHVWLPDAMEGPTPVSALIHAATMVAAGVYMLGRLFPIFSESATAMLFIAYIGLITAFFAATIAITQNDIKRVLAYSTISQLGYMVTALGVGAYTAGLYHLMTHAFFKALLFLGSGSVIHAVHTQDMREMGGLRSKLPTTFATMLIATLAISGIPFFSGFGSKDAILAGTMEFGLEHPQHFLIPLGLILAASITAFYMFRLIFMTFYGEPQDQETFDHAHESPRVMTTPLIVLAFLSAIGGFGLYGALWFNYLVVPPAIGGTAVEHGAEHGSAMLHYGVMALSIMVAALGIYLSYLVYYKKTISAARLAERMGLLYDLSYNKYYVDEFYQKTIIAFVLKSRMVLAKFDARVVDGIVNAFSPATRGSSSLAGSIDRYVVDGIVNLIAIVVQGVGSMTTMIQSGVIQNYLMKVGIAVMVLLFLHNVVVRLL
ncbi:MAG: NADH-quinone oxidoreductase subunit L [bacterium]|jgi:NADH-quinone oxidoreductase subunit L